MEHFPCKWIKKCECPYQHMNYSKLKFDIDLVSVGNIYGYEPFAHSRTIDWTLGQNLHAVELCFCD